MYLFRFPACDATYGLRMNANDQFDGCTRETFRLISRMVYTNDDH